MATRKDYLLETINEANAARSRAQLAQTNEDIARTAKESKEASERLGRALENAKKTGAGRGQVNPEAMVPRATNSRAQYEHEKAAGDPNANSLSFEEWKKL